MAKKKGNLYGVSNYIKGTPKKRKGRISKKIGPKKKNVKNTEAKVGNETYNDHPNVSYVRGRYQVRHF